MLLGVKEGVANAINQLAITGGNTKIQVIVSPTGEGNQ